MVWHTSALAQKLIADMHALDVLAEGYRNLADPRELMACGDDEISDTIERDADSVTVAIDAWRNSNIRRAA